MVMVFFYIVKLWWFSPGSNNISIYCAIFYMDKNVFMNELYEWAFIRASEIDGFWTALLILSKNQDDIFELDELNRKTRDMGFSFHIIGLERWATTRKSGICSVVIAWGIAMLFLYSVVPNFSRSITSCLKLSGREIYGAPVRCSWHS